MAPALRVATRGSALARRQADRVVELLDLPAEIGVVSTRGDERADVPIHTIGGVGVFVKEVEQAVLDGRADIAVHSAKDLPAVMSDGLALVAVPERGDARDALVGSTLDALPTGARVATGSVRRRAQLANARPDLVFAELRGNIETRLDKARRFDAVVVAAAALERLGALDRADELLDPSVMLPQVGQGSLAVECRIDDSQTRARLDAIDEVRAHRALDAERAFLAQLGGGCNLPCGALASIDDDNTVSIDALLASLDGHVALRARRDRSRPGGRRNRCRTRSARRERRTDVARRPRVGSGRLMTVYLVGAGPGDPGLLTVRGAQLLGQADVVVYDRLAPSALLDLAPPGAQLVAAGKAPGQVELTQDQINATLVEHGAAGRTVVRLKGGDPFVFGRGGEEAEVLPRGGYPVRSRSRDHERDCCARVRRHPGDASWPFDACDRGDRTRRPRQGTRRRRLGRPRSRAGGTLVILMGAGRIGDIAKRLVDGGRAADTPVAAVRNGTRPDQHTVRATLATIAAADVQAPAAIVVGDVAALDLAWFETRPLFGRSVVVTRAREQASELRSRLEAIGAEVLEMPAIAIEPVEFALPPLHRYAWLVFTSANGVEAFFSRGLAPAGLDVRALHGLRIAAIGPGTADTLTVRGVTADLVPERFVAESLLEGFPAPGAPGERVLVARAETARDVLPRGSARQRS